VFNDRLKTGESDDEHDFKGKKVRNRRVEYLHFHKSIL